MRNRYLGTPPVLLFTLLVSGTVTAEPIAFVDEDQFLAAASALGWSLFQEGFEDNSYWGSVRTSIVDGVYSAPGVAAQSLFLGDYPDNPVDFGETCDPPGSENCMDNAIIGTTERFFGVIDEAGFERFEYRELEGKLEVDGGDLKYIFADDFRISIVGGPLIFRDGFE